MKVGILPPLKIKENCICFEEVIPLTFNPWLMELSFGTWLSLSLISMWLTQNVTVMFKWD